MWPAVPVCSFCTAQLQWAVRQGGGARLRVLPSASENVSAQKTQTDKNNSDQAALEQQGEYLYPGGF